MVSGAPINFEDPALGNWYEDGINTGEYKIWTRRGWVRCDNWTDLQEELRKIESFSN